MMIPGFSLMSRSFLPAFVMLGLVWSPGSHAETYPEDLDDVYIRAIASPVRTDADRSADDRRKPMEFLQFAEVRPGMRVLDVAAGGGYTTQLLALVVGADGEVWAQSTEVNETLLKRLPNNPDQNIHAVALPYDDPVPKEATSLDLVTLIMNYHDIAYMPVDRARMDKQLFDALKQGGHLIVMDHSARAGSGTSDTKTLHRIDENVVLDELQQAGFKLEKEGEFMRNPDDPRDQPFFRMSIPTDKFALRFVKPRSF